MSVASLANRTWDIERKTLTRDAVGGQVRTWTNHLRLRGRIQPLSATDNVRAGREEELVTHRGYFAGTPDIVAGDRITSRRSSKVLHILAVRNIDEADRFLTVEIQERDA